LNTFVDNGRSSALSRQVAHATYAQMTGRRTHLCAPVVCQPIGRGKTMWRHFRYRLKPFFS